MIVIRRLREEDIPDVLSISLKELGEDYLDIGDFMDALHDPYQFCNVAEVDGTVVGFAVCRVFEPFEEPDVLGLPEGEDRDMVLNTPRSGILDSVSIEDSVKGKGVGTVLCQKCHDEMVELGCGLICAMAWKSYTGRTNIAGILSRMGMTERVAIQGYWNRMVDSPEGHHCPECGAPCHCYGVFWAKKV